MSLNSTPSGERKHISIFGCRNAGKSSLLNAIAGQEIAIVSDIAGTTTDPVKKAIELLPAGPVMLTDTPGLDDEGILGDLRIDSAKKILRRTDLAIVVIDSQKGESEFDLRILKLIKDQNIPYIKVWNKCDIKKIDVNDKKICVSALTGEGINKLKEQLALMLNEINNDKSLVGDIVNEKDTVVLVIPIDKAAPKARLILPQQQTIRDLLDHGAVSVCIRDTELKDYISESKNKISLVITDSQVVKKVSEIVPEDIPLTTFSILFSKYKGELETQLDALRTIDNLKDDDWVLIAEGCSHHRQCGDIGSEKIPAMLNNIANINFDFTSGLSWPEDLSKYKLIIHCGACMLNEKEMKARINKTKRTNVPITNYGMLFSKINGVLDRTIKAINQNV